MIDNAKSSNLKSQIEKEIKQYLTEEVELPSGEKYSEYKLKKRIAIFESRTYPTGKFDSQGNYKYWFDGIIPRIANEVKNIDFDSSAVGLWSPRKSDELPNIVANLANEEYMRTTGRAQQINSDIEQFSGWGNVLWKRVPGSYERTTPLNTYTINQTAETVDQTPIIERHQFSQSDLRDYAGKWQNIDEAIRDCGTKTYKTSTGTMEQETTVPYYDIFERNGEVCLFDYLETIGETPTDKDRYTYVQAKIIAAGTMTGEGSVDIKYILFAKATKGRKNSDIYKVAHRGAYKGRFWREGLYELLFDCQVRWNQIGNQIAVGLEYASKTWFTAEEKLAYANIQTDLRNGDIIRSKGLKQVEVRMNGLDQLIAEYNRIVQIADHIANSYETVTGEGGPAATPFRLGALYNQNANKLFDFLREKLAIPLSEIYEQWVLDDLIATLKADDVLRLTGDADMLNRLMIVLVDNWYISNLIALGPHSPEEGAFLKSIKLQELQSRPQLLLKGVQKLFKDYKPHARVEITGENSRRATDIESLSNFIPMEADPVRRQALIEKAMKRVGIDAAALPKLPPQALAPQGPAPAPTGAPAV